MTQLAGVCTSTRMAANLKTTRETTIRTYTVAGLRPIKRTLPLDDELPTPWETFAKRLALQAYGSRGTVRSLREDCRSQDGSVIEFEAFIGVPGPGRQETTGHNVRFTVSIS